MCILHGADLGGKHQLVLVPPFARTLPGLVLVGPVLAEDRSDVAGERERAPRLRGLCVAAERHRPPDLDVRRQATLGLHPHPIPAQSPGLLGPQTKQKRHDDGGVHVVLTCALDQVGCLHPCRTPPPARPRHDEDGPDSSSAVPRHAKQTTRRRGKRVGRWGRGELLTTRLAVSRPVDHPMQTMQPRAEGRSMG